MNMKRLIPHYVAKRYQDGIFHGNFNAASLFADISGFTKITERLAEHGKEGAEILSGIINEVFSPCIWAVYQRGGFITTFAGDSFTAVFPEKPVEACRAAIKIKNEVSAQNIKTTKYGKFNISVKIGISYGNIEWGILGKKHQKTYYFKGRAIDGSAEAEKHSDPMSIIVDNSIIGPIKETAEFSETSKGFYSLLHINARKSLNPNYEHVDINDDILMRFIPEILRENKPLDELRNAVSIFLCIDDTGWDHDCYNDFATTIMDTVHKWGGYFSRIGFGDKGCTALINFGIPVLPENNISRSMDFALEIKSLYKSKIKAGVTFGRLFSGYIGSSIRSAYDVLGDAVNLSARIGVSAEWGRIWVSKAVYDNASYNYNFDFINSFSFKGKSEKADVFELAYKKDIQELHFKGNMYGRDTEIEKIKSFIDPFLKSIFPGVIYIYGEAGIGKSRIAFETAKDYSSHAEIMHMPCESTIRKAWNPLIHLLNVFFGLKSSQPADKREFIFKNRFIRFRNKISEIGDERSEAVLIEVDRSESFIRALLSLDTKDTLYEMLDAKGRYENTLWSLKAFFKAISLIRPVLILIEDIHWIDEDSRLFLKHLTRNIQDYPISIIITTRYNDDGTKPEIIFESDVNQAEILLGPVSDCFLGEIIKEILGCSPDSDMLSFIKIRSENNPFYIEQLCLYLKENRYISHKADICSITKKTEHIPLKINQILISRIDRLSREIKELVKIASVLGAEFDKNILFSTLEMLSLLLENYKRQASFDIEAIRLLQVSRDSDILGKARKDNIWDSLDEIIYIFRHALLRDSAYDMQLRERLRFIHHTVGQVIERIVKADAESNKDYYIDLAYHYEKAGDKAKTRVYLEKAGDNSKNTYRNREALEIYKRLLKITGSKEKLVSIQIKTGEIYELMGNLDKAMSLYRECIDISEAINDISFLSDSYSYLGRACYIKSEYKKAISCHENSRKLAVEIGDEIRTANALSCLANVYDDLGNYSKALEYIDACSEIYLKHGNKKGIASTLINRGNVLIDQHKLDEALECFKKSMKIMKEIGEKRAVAIIYNSIGTIYFNQMQFDRAAEGFNEYRKISQEIGDKRGIGISVGNMGVIYKRQLKYEKALECYEIYRKNSTEIGDKKGIGISYVNIGSAYREMGKYQKSLEYFNKHKQLAEKMDDRRDIGIALFNIANTYLYMGRYNEALKYFDASIPVFDEMADKMRLAHVYAFTGDIYFETRHFPKAVECYDRAIQIYTEIDCMRSDYAHCMLQKSVILLADKDIKGSIKYNRQAMKAAVQVDDKEYIFRTKVHEILIKSSNNKEQAVRSLIGMLDNTDNTEEKAVLYYELFKLEKTKEYKNKAIKFYRQLYKKEPFFFYKTKINELKKIKD